MNIMSLFSFYGDFMTSQVDEKEEITEVDPNEDQENGDLTSIEESTIEIKSQKEEIPYLTIKSIGDNRIKGRAILWGTPEEKDFVGDYFDERTKGLMTVFDLSGKLPWLYEHGRHEKIGPNPIAVIDKMEIDDWGVVYEAAIRDHDTYRNFVSKLIEEGKLYSSSGALPGTRKSADDGLLTSWVVAEVSGTVKPMDHRQLTDGVITQIKSFNVVEDYAKAIEDLTEDSEQGDEESRDDDKGRLLQLKQNQLQLNIILQNMEIV